MIEVYHLSQIVTMQIVFQAEPIARAAAAVAVAAGTVQEMSWESVCLEQKVSLNSAL